MTTSNIDPITPVSSSSPSPHFLKVGLLCIEGREYTVSVESSDPLIKSPHADTLDKIRDLVNFHLNYLNTKGVDLSTIVIQQLDERGLSYVKKDTEKDIEQKLLPYSEVGFMPYTASNPFMEATYPPSLKDPFIANLKDVYRSIIHSLEENTFPTSPENFFNSRMDFAPTNEASIPKQPIIKSSDECSEPEEEDEISESEAEDVGLISGQPNDPSQYNQEGGIINNIKFQASNLFSRMRSFLPTLRPETDAINPEELIAKEESRFRSGLSNEEQATLAKFATIQFD